MAMSVQFQRGPVIDAVWSGLWMCVCYKNMERCSRIIVLLSWCTLIVYYKNQVWRT